MHDRCIIQHRQPWQAVWKDLGRLHALLKRFRADALRFYPHDPVSLFLFLGRDTACRQFIKEPIQQLTTLRRTGNVRQQIVRSSQQHLIGDIVSIRRSKRIEHLMDETVLSAPQPFQQRRSKLVFAKVEQRGVFIDQVLSTGARQRACCRALHSVRHGHCLEAW